MAKFGRTGDKFDRRRAATWTSDHAHRGDVWRRRCEYEAAFRARYRMAFDRSRHAVGLASGSVSSEHAGQQRSQNFALLTTCASRQIKRSQLKHSLPWADRTQHDAISAVRLTRPPGLRLRVTNSELHVRISCKLEIQTGLRFFQPGDQGGANLRGFAVRAYGDWRKTSLSPIARFQAPHVQWLRLFRVLAAQSQYMWIREGNKRKLRNEMRCSIY